MLILKLVRGQLKLKENKTMKLTETQQSICDAVVRNVKTYPGRFDCVISGNAGTGKSTTVSEIIKKLSKDYEFAVTSPTHKANQVLKKMINGSKIEKKSIMTIHSFLGLKLVPDKLDQKLVHDSHSKNANLNVDILIIDECSMVSDELYSFIVSSAHRVRRAIIFVGDDCQLPPVDKSNSNSVRISKTFQHGTPYQLTEVLRQALDNPIMQLATNVRETIRDPQYPSYMIVKQFPENDNFAIADYELFIGSYISMIEEGLDKSSKFYYHDLFNNSEIYKILSYTNKNVDNYNSIVRTHLIGGNVPGLVEGEPIVFSETGLSCPRFAQESIPCPPVKKEIWMGVEVWQVTDMGQRYYVVGPNEQAAYKKHLNSLVHKINSKEINTFTKRPHTWQDYYILKEKINVVNYPYATTIHKSQGSTFDTTWLDLDYVDRIDNIQLMGRIVYTALTRPKNHIILLKGIQ